MQPPEDNEPDAPPPSHAESPSFRDTRWRWGEVLIGLAPILVAPSALSLLRQNVPNFAPRSWVPFTALSMAWMLAYPLWVARRRGGLPPLPKIRAVATEAFHALLAIPLLMICVFVVKLVLTAFLHKTIPDMSPLGPIAASPDRFESMALVVFAVAVAPFAEEIFFRGMFYNALKRRLGVVLAATLQAAVFGFGHPFGVVDRAAITAVGFVIALIYERRKTLLSPILLHLMMNTLGAAALFWTIASYTNSPVFGVRTTPEARGCLITEVVPGSSADASGLRIGDVVTAVAETPVAETADLVGLMHTKRVGDKVSVDFIRGDDRLRVEATLKARTP